ncbi:MAG: acylphosphatase [Balneolaceae bacterium]|nr:acylphosphatase [Balneolaceae bacterium]
MKRAHIFIEGHVQGVGFRHFTKTNARQSNIKGWVKNLSDGRVEAVFEGKEESIQKMIDLVKQGPRASRVDNVEVRVGNTGKII